MSGLGGFVLVAVAVWFIFAISVTGIAGSRGWSDSGRLSRYLRPTVRPGRAGILDVLVLLLVAGVTQALMVVALVDPVRFIGRPNGEWIALIELGAAVAFVLWFARQARRSRAGHEAKR